MSEKPIENNQLYDRIERSSRRKRLALTVTADNLIVVKASNTEKLAVIERFVKENERWITAKKSQIKKLQETEKKYIDGEIFYIKGEIFTLKIDDKQLAPLKVIKDEKIISLAHRYQQNAFDLILKWYHLNAEEYLLERAESLLIKHSLRYQKIKIKSTKSQWGSCSLDGNLSLTWHLFMLPVDVSDYVIIHELAHLNEMNHSALFWSEVEAMLPDYYIHRAYLKEYGTKIISSLNKNITIFE